MIKHSAFLLTLLAAGTAQAGPVESLRAVAFHPTDPARMAAVYSEAGGGILVSQDAGKSFALTCATAIFGARSLRGGVPHVQWTTDGKLLVAAFQGLFIGDGNGCGFQRVASLGNAVVSDLLRDPDRPSTFYALTSSASTQNGIYRSQDDGQTWSPLGALEPWQFRQLRFATMADGARRLYMSVCRQSEDGLSSECALRVADEQGVLVEQRIVPGAETLWLLGVDARVPERLYLAAAYPDRFGVILLQHDWDSDGRFQELGKALEIGSVLLDAEGGYRAVDPTQHLMLRVKDGMLSSTSSSLSNLTCLAEERSRGQLLACATATLWPADRDGNSTGAQLLDLQKVQSYAACQGLDMPALCRDQMDFGWCGPTHYSAAPICSVRSEGLVAQGDAGVASDAGADDEPARAPNKRDDSCSVLTVGSKQSRFGYVHLALLGLGLWGLKRAARARGTSRSQ